MVISVGDRVPGAELARIGENGPEAVALGPLLAGRSVVIFALPGAFTPTCHAAHVPSFIRTRAQFAARGVDEIVCISVNDPFVMQAWAEATGAAAAGITMLADPEAAFTRSAGMVFTAPFPSGLTNRSLRYAMHVVDGVVKVLHVEQARGTCETTGGEAMLDAI